MLTAFMTPVARMHGRRCAIRTPAPWSCSLPAPGRPRPLWAAHLRAQGRRLWLRVQSAGGEEPMELQPGVNGNFRVDEEDDEDLGLDGEEGVPEESLDLDEGADYACCVQTERGRGGQAGGGPRDVAGVRAGFAGEEVKPLAHAYSRWRSLVSRSVGLLAAQPPQFTVRHWLALSIHTSHSACPAHCPPARCRGD